MHVITVTDETRGTIIGDRIKIADTSLSRMVGLLGQRGVDTGGGLWIKPSSGVHTLFMRFPIDVIGLDKNMRVIKLWRSLVPYRITSVSLQLRSVIELSSGRIAECGVQLGDVLRVN
jgi:uncharacterized protein